jgi:hypothetical protein
MVDVRSWEENMLQVVESQMFQQEEIMGMESVGGTTEDFGGERRGCWKY